MISNKPFHEQLDYYTRVLHTQLSGSRSGIPAHTADYIINEICNHLGTLSPSRFKEMLLPPSEKALAPSGAFIDGLLLLLVNNRVLVVGSADYVALKQAATAAQTQAKNRQWPIMGQIDHIHTKPIAGSEAGSYGAALKRHRETTYSPRGMENKKSADALLEEHYKAGHAFEEFLNAMMKEWGFPDAVAFTRHSNHNLQTIANTKDRLNPDMIRQWRYARQRGHRGFSEPVELFCKAYGFDEMQQHMIWRMLHGHVFTPSDYDDLAAQAIEKNNTAILVRGLIEASGLPKSYIEKRGNVHHLAEQLGGARFETAEKARRFIEYVMPARMDENADPDPEILRRQQHAIHLLSSSIAHKPEALARNHSSRPMRDIFLEAVHEHQTFQGFMRKLLSEWQLKPEDLQEIIAYRHEQLGEKQIVWNSTLREWANSAQTSFHSDSVRKFRIGIGLDERDELDLWRMIAGRNPENLETLMEQAKQGDTGPLINELYQASGIPFEYLEKIVPTSQLHPWIHGGKILDRPVGERFLNLVYPVARGEEHIPTLQFTSNMGRF